MVAPFSAWLRTAYRKTPQKFGQVASERLIVVRLLQRRWRGYRVADDADVSITGDKPQEAVITKPRWRLCPPEMQKRFDALSLRVTALLTNYALSAQRVRRGRSNVQQVAEDEDDDTQGVLLGRGIFVVDKSAYSALRERVMGLRREWMEEADYWTSDEGYTYLQDCVRRVIGDVPYRDRVLTLIPSRAELRARFNLEFYRLSVRLEMKEDRVMSSMDQDERDGVEAMVLELYEAAVRNPRKMLVNALEAVYPQIIALPVIDAYRLRTDKEGDVCVRVKSASVGALRRGVQNFLTAAGRWCGSLQTPAKELLDALGSDTKEINERIALQMRTDRDVALEWGEKLYRLAVAAQDEALMISDVEANFQLEEWGLTTVTTAQRPLPRRGPKVADDTGSA